MAKAPTVAPPLMARLVEAATRLFAEQGFEATSVQEVVQSAGVTKGALYHYFSSKDDLLYQIYRRVLTLQMERLERISAAGGDVTQRLHRAAADVVLSSFEHFDAVKVFFTSVQLLAPEQQSEARADWRRYLERFRAMVEQGQRDGVFRTDVSADLAVHAFFGSLNQVLRWWRPGGTLGASDVAAQLADLFVGGLRRA